jgi:predicted MFS family arabinose efflux permease
MNSHVIAHNDQSGQATSRRLMTAIVLGPFLGNLIMLAPPPFFPLMSEELGISVPLLGQVMTAMLLLSAALALLAGPLADFYGHRRLMIIGIVAAVLSLLGFALSPVYGFLIISGLIGSLAIATLPGLSVAVASARFAGDARRKALGWTSSAGAGSAVIGVPALVFIADQFGWRVSLGVAGILALGGVWLIYRSIPGVENAGRGRLTLQTFGASYGMVFRDAGTVRVLIATVLRTVCWAGYLTYLSTLLHRELGLSTGQIGVMFFLGGVAYIVSSLNAGRVLNWIALRPAVAIANGGMAVMVGVVLSGIAGYWLTLVLIPLTAVAAGIGWVSIVTLMAEESPAEAGTKMAINAAAFSLGAAGGGAVGGLALAIGSFPLAGVVLAVAALSASALIFAGRAHAVQPAAS